MPKILFVEDELTKNIASIRKFFAPVLKDKRIYSELKALENENRIYAEDIIKACRYSSELDIAYTLPTALEKLLTNHKYYDLIIIDRNLSLHQYANELEHMVEMLQSAGFDYSADRIREFHEREGDFLLLIALRLNRAYKDKIYYLTANTGDELRGSPEMKTFLDIQDFTKDHIIEKGSPQEETISIILSDLNAFKIQNSYRTECDIIRKRLREEDVSQFIEIVSYFERDKRRDFAMNLRKFLDNILHDVAFKIDEPDAEYWNNQNNDQLTIKSFIKGFKSRTTNAFVGLPGYDEIHPIGYSSIIRNACLSIFEICSDYGVHELSKAITTENQNADGLSPNTLKSLLCQMKDVIAWYDKAMDLIPK